MISDTTPEMAALHRKLLMERSGEERLRMASDMFDAAVEMFLATLPPGMPERERRVKRFLRFYGREFSESERERIVARIRQPRE